MTQHQNHFYPYHRFRFIRFRVSVTAYSGGVRQAAANGVQYPLDDKEVDK